MTTVVYYYNKKSSEPCVLREPFGDCPNMQQVFDKWAIARLTPSTEYVFLATDSLTVYEEMKEEYKKKHGLLSLSEVQLRQAAQEHLLARGVVLPWVRIKDHKTGRDKPPPQVPAEVWNAKPVSADSAMAVVRLLCGGAEKKPK